MSEHHVRPKPPPSSGRPATSRGGEPQPPARPASAPQELRSHAEPGFDNSTPPAKFSLRAPPPEGQRKSTGRERILKQRMQIAAGTFWLWVVVTTAIAVMAMPIGNDANTMAALKETQGFADTFDAAMLERTLHAHVIALAAAPLHKVTQRITGRGVPKVNVAEGAAPLAPWAKFELGSLARVEALTRPQATLAIDVAAPESIGEALAWRLSRLPEAERYALQRITLMDGRCTRDDLAREQEITRLRGIVLQSRGRVSAAEQKQLAAEKSYEALRKWKRAPWKAIAKANEKRVETKTVLGQAQQELMEGAAAYEASAERALSLGEGTSNGADPSCRLAVATLLPKSAPKPLEFRLPARVEPRSIPAPKIAGASFGVSKRVGVWDEIKDSPAQVAAAQLRGHFSWHNRYAQVAGIKLGGMTVLQFAPLLTLAVLLLLIRSCRRVSAAYNPFDPPMIANLPMVGFSSPWANAALLALLPLAGCALCAWALQRIDQLPVVPVVCGLGSLGLAVVAHLSLRRLLELREAIMQSHDNRASVSRSLPPQS